MNTVSTRSVFFLLLTICAVIGFITAGCKPQKQAAPPESITIAYSTATSDILSHIAFANNFYLAEGLEAIPQPHDFGKLALQSVLNGKANIATVADTPIMFAVMEGRPVAIIARIQSSEKNEAIVARKDRGIVKPRDLKGKKIGVTRGTTSDFFLYAFLLDQNIERKQVKVVHLTPAQMPAALKAGKVDAVSTWNPTLFQLQKEWNAKASLFYGEHLYAESFCIVATQEYVKKNPEAIKKLLRALIKAEKFAREYPEDSRRLVADFIKADKASLDELWEIFDFRITLTQGLLLSLEDQTRWAIRHGLTARRDMPNYLDYIYFDGLKAVKPEAVRIIH
jgi:NitT/TauT family transport system substrate-binding protein